MGKPARSQNLIVLKVRYQTIKDAVKSASAFESRRLYGIIEFRQRVAL